MFFCKRARSLSWWAKCAVGFKGRDVELKPLHSLADFSSSALLPPEATSPQNFSPSTALLPLLWWSPAAGGLLLEHAGDWWGTLARSRERLGVARQDQVRRTHPGLAVDQAARGGG
jgi:hypothetical protein